MNIDKETEEYNSNGLHDWMNTSAIFASKSGPQEMKLCRKCGISNTLGGVITNCLPWETPKQRNTDDGSNLRVNLYSILERLNGAEVILKHALEIKSWYLTETSLAYLKSIQEEIRK